MAREMVALANGCVVLPFLFLLTLLVFFCAAQDISSR
jgi:hypothetical protein